MVPTVLNGERILFFHTIGDWSCAFLRKIKGMLSSILLPLVGLEGYLLLFGKVLQ
jgi:hypothetical protein